MSSQWLLLYRDKSLYILIVQFFEGAKSFNMVCELNFEFLYRIAWGKYEHVALSCMANCLMCQ